MPKDYFDELVSGGSGFVEATLIAAVPPVDAKTFKGLRLIIAAVSSQPETLLAIPRGRATSVADLARRWVAQYLGARDSSTLTRTSTGVSTVPDAVIDVLIAAAVGEKVVSAPKIGLIREGHRLSMEAENLVGSLLEEYLDEQIGDAGWTCCWGSVVRAVDFIGPAGELLQVKNKSNSENSSSSRVRLHTEIKKWHRLDARTGATNWRKLEDLTGVTGLSEDGFHAFVIGRIRKNPMALAVPLELRYPPAPAGKST